MCWSLRDILTVSFSKLNSLACNLGLKTSHGGEGLGGVREGCGRGVGVVLEGCGGGLEALG